MSVASFLKTVIALVQKGSLQWWCFIGNNVLLWLSLRSSVAIWVGWDL